MKEFRVQALLFLFGVVAAFGQAPQQEPYSWKNVQIVGGGFVDGIIFHPTAPGVRYARTDIGGAYRWDATAHRWQPMMDWVPYKDRNLMGIEAIAIDPSDPNRVYLACGSYTNAHSPNGAILRSDDRGHTFLQTDVPFKFGGGEDGRGNGERLSVDPHDGRILYLGTRHDGLWRSRDRGATWMRVTSFPDVTEAPPPPPTSPPPAPVPSYNIHERHSRDPVVSSGIIFIKFGPRTGSRSPSAATGTIYVGVSLMNRPNLFVSTDGGESWRGVPGAPTKYRPTRAALSTDGFLYVAYGTSPGPWSRMADGAVWKLNTRTGEWTDVTPDRPIAGRKQFGYAAVSVDAQHPGSLIASSFGRSHSAGGEDIFRSTDGGANWKPIFGSGGLYDYSLAPYVKSTPIHWLFDIEIDPTNSDHAVFTTGYGGWETFDLTGADRGKPTHWSILASGIEETVDYDLNSPAQGAHLITGLYDYGGFVHWDLDHPAPEGSPEPPRMGYTMGVASATLRPEVIVRVGIGASFKPGENIGYSLDEGRTWKACVAAPTPESHAGSIAVSADGSTWVWTPDQEPAHVTHDLGTTWTAATGLPAGGRVIADPVDPRSFYAVSLADLAFYRSSDGGATFTAQHFTLSDAPPAPAPPSGGGGQARIYAAPGRAADIWMAAYGGLYHILPPGQQASGDSISFVRLPGVEDSRALGFGEAAPHESYPALYLAGTVHGQPGVFRSTDEARTWVRVNDDQHQWGVIQQIIGDPRLYGRVYVGTSGRGVLYGDPIAR
ncbi:MAG: exo-alpha-sialidase [Bryobacteraceae bacterium]